MKRVKHLLIGLLFGVAMGWVLGYLRFPFLPQNTSFLLGFGAAITFVAFLVSLWTVWGTGLPAMPFAQTKNRFGLGRLAPVAVLVLGSIMGGVSVYRQRTGDRLQMQAQADQIKDLKALVENLQAGGHSAVTNQILGEVGKAAERHPHRALSDSLIAKIAALSQSFKTFRYIEHDTLSQLEGSPDRGQLLQALVLLDLDTGTFTKIKRQTVFAGAVLRGANLKGLDLSGIQLQGANLQGADLSDANLQGANLNQANLWNAHLNRANLTKTDLKRAEMGWAQLNGAILVKANLNGANLPNAQFLKANLFDASCKFAQVTGALFNEANLISVDFVGTDFTQANLMQANLNDTDLRKIVLSQAMIAEATFTKAIVDKDWSQRVDRWQPLGGKALLDKYAIVNDTFDKLKNPLYRLIAHD